MSEPNPRFKTSFESFLDSSTRLVESVSDNTLTTKHGRKYIKIIMRRKGHIVAGSAWAFISLETGDIFRPANWSRPAKHSRGNIFDANNGLKSIAWTGPKYLK